MNHFMEIGGLVKELEAALTETGAARGERKKET